MTENQKRLGIIGAVLIIIIILFMNRGSANSTVVNNAGALPDIILPDSPNITLGQRRPFVLPDFGPQNNANNLSAIGACCADCSGRKPVQSYVPASRGLTIVNNAGNSGPNVFNFFNPSPPPPQPFQWRSRGVGVRMM